MPPRKKKSVAAAPPVGELVMMNPADLQVGPNVRLAPGIDDELIESIRERGVLQPIVAWRNDDGQVVVQFGQRRTLAAVKAARAVVPVMVVPRPADVDRLTDQINENEHRAALSAADRVRGWEQLSALGLSAAQIAKRTAAPREDVTAGLAVAASPAARAVLESPNPGLTLPQVATIAEFDGDEDAVQLLTLAAEQGGWDHTVQQLRDARREAELLAVAGAELAALGVTVIDVPAWNAPPRQLDRLGLDRDEHAGCPGHAAYLSVGWYAPDPDCDDEAADEAPAQVEVDVVYVCTDPVTHGHTPAPTGPRVHPTPAPAGPDPDAAAEAAAAARREVIANNKAWESATRVRRIWLRSFLTRRTPPKGAAGFVASAFGWCDYALSRARENGNELAHELFGLVRTPGYGGRGLAIDEALGQSSDNRAQLIALGLVLAAYEEATTREHWRTQDAGTVRYLHYLEACGYELSDVEQRACAPAGH